MKKSQNLPLLFLVALLSICNSCLLTKGKKIGEHGVDQFHNQLNAGQHREIYVQAHKTFREHASEQEFVAVLEAVRRKLGTVKSANQTGWNVHATPAGTFVSLSYEAEFTQGKGTEHFFFLIEGDQAKLYQYTINSPVFIKN